jgi:hypothetical protein
VVAYVRKGCLIYIALQCWKGAGSQIVIRGDLLSLKVFGKAGEECRLDLLGLEIKWHETEADRIGRMPGPVRMKERDTAMVDVSMHLDSWIQLALCVCPQDCEACQSRKHQETCQNWRF